MTPEEFLRKRRVITDDQKDLVIGFDNGTEERLSNLLEKYHEEKLMSLGISAASGEAKHGCGNLLTDKEIFHDHCLKCSEGIEE